MFFPGRDFQTTTDLLLGSIFQCIHLLPFVITGQININNNDNNNNNKIIIITKYIISYKKWTGTEEKGQIKSWTNPTGPFNLCIIIYSCYFFSV